MRVRNLESRSVDGHLAAMHFCFLPVQDSPVSLPPLVPSSPPSSPSKPCILSLHLPAQPLARHSFCITLLSPLSPFPSPFVSPFPAACSNIGAGVLHPFVLYASYHRLPARENAGNLPRSFSPLPLVRVSCSSEELVRHETGQEILLRQRNPYICILDATRGSFLWRLLFR